MRKITAVTLVLLGLGPVPEQGRAQPPSPDAPPQRAEGTQEAPDPTARALARALDLRLTVWRGSGRVVHAAHCREHRGGCRARIAAMARLFATVSRRHGVDPFLLAAVALRESGLNPFAEGGAGERGIVQLHPRGVGSRVRFVRNDAYRSRCRRSADACQEEVLDAGAALIAASMERCGGAAEGLGAYNTGRCGETGYSRRVLRERLRLLRLAKTRPTPSAPALLD